MATKQPPEPCNGGLSVVYPRFAGQVTDSETWICVLNAVAMQTLRPAREHTMLWSGKAATHAPELVLQGLCSLPFRVYSHIGATETCGRSVRPAPYVNNMRKCGDDHLTSRWNWDYLPTQYALLAVWPLDTGPLCALLSHLPGPTGPGPVYLP